MSLKALELQIAIPKTFEAGKIADQHQQNVIGQQVNAHESLKKDIKKKRLQVSDTQKSDKITDDKNQDHNQKQEALPEEKLQHKEEREAKHPFKGNLIDYSG
ncbi:MAG TPA: RNA polymerase subunit sigma [Ureibacillus sp.]|nr:RNA polymerase subunit sigma [Ureibacillus sp.]